MSTVPTEAASKSATTVVTSITEAGAVEDEVKDDAKATEKQNVTDANKQAVDDQDDALEVLEPKAAPKIWIIGKPPEAGGNEDEYSIYTQRPLGYFARLRFFSLVSKTIGTAVKAGGGVDLGGDFLNTVDDIRTKRSVDESDFADAGAFIGLAMQLISYSPDFLLECYCLWLDVPVAEKVWAKMVMEQRHDPDNNKWGLTDDQGLEMVEVFIDQNYEDIRRFFAEKVPGLMERVKAREQDHKAHESTSALSKR